MRTKFFSLFLFIHCVDSGCQSLFHKKGVKLECSRPGNDTISDCTSEDVPQGTIATFSCAKFYYQEKSPRQGAIICVEDDIWEHYYDYVDFNCKIGCGISRKISPAIVNGKATDNYNFPWHATIFIRNQTSDLFDLACGGSLIDLNDEGPLILTAAHCLGFNMEDYRIILGGISSIFLENIDGNSKIFRVVAYNAYPSYNNISLDNDIGVFELREEIVYSDTIKPICLHRGTREPKAGDNGNVAGFGLTESGENSKKMLFSKLPIRSWTVCKDELNLVGSQDKFNITITATKFCAGFPFMEELSISKDLPQGICKGDSGGGFVVFHPIKKIWIIVGIASSAILTPISESKNSCWGLGYFQSVQKYIGWIREIQRFIYPNEVEKELEETKIQLNQAIEELREIKAKNCAICELEKGFGLSTDVWYTFSNKHLDVTKNYGPYNYMTWVREGSKNIGQVAWKGFQHFPNRVDYVSKYRPGGSKSINAHWKLQKTATPGAYTLYNRALGGVLVATNDGFTKIVNESDLTPDDGHWCFKLDKDPDYAIELCKQKDGRYALISNFNSITEEGNKLYLHFMGGINIWKVGEAIV